MSVVVLLESYLPGDLPACLASLGMLHLLTRRRAFPVRLSWASGGDGGSPGAARLHLPEGATEGDLVRHLADLAAERAESPHWDLLDLCDDGVGWLAASQSTPDRPASRELQGGGVYFDPPPLAPEVGKRRRKKAAEPTPQGGRSPLICTSRNGSPGVAGRTAAQAAAKRTDWRHHFEQWSPAAWRGRTPLGYQGWRENVGAAHKASGGEVEPSDPAAVWLAYEALACLPCLPARPICDPERPLDRKGIGCPGWDQGTSDWVCPTPSRPVRIEGLESMIHLGAFGWSTRFERFYRVTAGYATREFRPGVPQFVPHTPPRDRGDDGENRWLWDELLCGGPEGIELLAGGLS